MQINLRHVCKLVVLLRVRAVDPQIGPSYRALHAAFDVTKKDKSLSKVVPKEELSVAETAFLARLVSRTRSWINEVAPGMQ
jgi:hypothetical protein